jgi:hypothetical protein
MEREEGTGMVIDKVIFTIDDNPHYKGFWKSISKHYVTRMGIYPKLFIISDRDVKSEYCTEYGEVECVEKLIGIPGIIQALIGKFYFTKTELNTTWIIGDLDLYPLQLAHFKERILNVRNDSYVHLNPYAYGRDWRSTVDGLAGYYHIATGEIFQKELKFENKSFLDVCNEIMFSNKFGIKFNRNIASIESKKASDDWGWFCCEEMYTGYLLKDSSKLLEIPPESYNRIDRSNMLYNTDLLKNGHYIDFHAPRPYEEHENVIENILNHFPNL